MRFFSIVIASCLLAVSHAATLDLDITDWDNLNYDLSEQQYDVINIHGQGSVNFATFYTSDNGTQLNISEGATVHLNDIVITDGPLVMDLNGGTFDFASDPTITVVLDRADLSKEGELYFPAFYYDAEQLGGDWFAFASIAQSMANSSFSFVTTDNSSYEFMDEIHLKQELLSDNDWNIPTGSSIYYVGATNTKVIPEPATATLSLLALAALAARRRRASR